MASEPGRAKVTDFAASDPPGQAVLRGRPVRKGLPRRAALVRARADQVQLVEERQPRHVRLRRQLRLRLGREDAARHGQSGRLGGGVLAITGSSDWIGRREAALRTRAKRRGTSDPTERPWLFCQWPPTSPFAPRLTMQAAHPVQAPRPHGLGQRGRLPPDAGAYTPPPPTGVLVPPT